MRLVAALYLALTSYAAEPGQPAKKGSPPATIGIKTPGIQIPFASLKSEREYTPGAPAPWIGVSDAIWIPVNDALRRIDPRAKEAKLGDPITGLARPCSGMVDAFTTLWMPNCGNGTVARVDAKGAKVTATLAIGADASTRRGIAATPDSVWAFTDTKGTLSRIDPAQNAVVAELRVFPDCNAIAFGESAVWVTCPAENKLLRVDPQTNLVDKTIEVSPHPGPVALGENSVWVLCEKAGKLDRVDPKTNKVTKTIELGAAAAGASMAIGEGSLWVSMPGFPITRVDMTGEKVAQQFWGEGAGAIQAALGSVWLSDAKSGKLWKFDPKRIAATLAE